MNKLILFFTFIFTSCSLPKLYRATIGISTNNSVFKNIEKQDDGSKEERKLCVDSVSNNVGNVEKCSGGGYKQDKGIGHWDPWLEFMPTYFGKSSFGFSYFFAFNRSETTLRDYPIVDEKTDVEIDRISFNPIFFYNFGDNYIKGGKGISFRVGLGGALNYVSRFEITR